MKTATRLLLSRLVIATVFLWNVQCALAFLLWPDQYRASFELTGIPGQAAVRGIGLLFLMWNVPYGVALWQPIRHRMSLYQALAMQAIGLVGETYIWLTLPAAHHLLRASLLRFILFDGAGLIFLALALWLTRRIKHP